MPTYTLRNIETGEIFDHVMKMSEYDNYMKSNPTIERYHEAAATIVDPSTLGIQKPPSDFQKHVIGNIQRRNPGRAQSKKFNVPKEW
jgi:hypothetical protein